MFQVSNGERGTWQVVRILDGSVTIPSGKTLIIDPDVEVRDWVGGNNGLRIYGTLEANTVNLSGNGQHIIVYSGGQANLSNCTIPSHYAKVEYQAGSSGTLDNVYGNNGWNLLVYSDSVSITNGTTVYGVHLYAPITVSDSIIDVLTLNSTATITGCTIGSIGINEGIPTVTGNMFTGSEPIRISDPDLQTTGFSDNTYTASNPKIVISGTLNGTRTLDALEGLTTYFTTGALIVNAGAALIIPPGITFDDWGGIPGLRIYGTLEADTVNLSGNGQHIIVYSGGQANLSNCTVPSQYATIEYQAGSSGTLTNVYGNNGWNLLVYSISVAIRNNDFSGAWVHAYGESSVAYDFEYNWWGTTDPNVIETKITHHVDDPTRPWVDYTPFLTGPPLPSNTISNIAVSQRNDSSKFVDIYYDLTGASTDVFTISIEISDDGGAKWNVPATSFTGDIGSGITPGTGKHIIWDCKADLPGVIGSNYKVRVIADDGN